MPMHSLTSAFAARMKGKTNREIGYLSHLKATEVQSSLCQCTYSHVLALLESDEKKIGKFASNRILKLA